MLQPNLQSSRARLWGWLEVGFTMPELMGLLDRRKSEEHINSFPNYVCPVRDDDGKVYDIHFAALFSKKQDAVPLLLLHGWPGTSAGCAPN